MNSQTCLISICKIDYSKIMDFINQQGNEMLDLSKEFRISKRSRALKIMVTYMFVMYKCQ